MDEPPVPPVAALKALMKGLDDLFGPGSSHSIGKPLPVCSAGLDDLASGRAETVLSTLSVPVRWRYPVASDGLGEVSGEDGCWRFASLGRGSWASAQRRALSVLDGVVGVNPWILEMPALLVSLAWSRTGTGQDVMVPFSYLHANAFQPMDAREAWAWAGALARERT